MLYVLECGNETKVGICKHNQLVRRICNLQTGRGEQIKVFSSYHLYGYEIEQDILKHFDQYRPHHYCPLTGKKKSKKSEWLIGIDRQLILDYIADNDSRWQNLGWAEIEEVI